jgi:hypothetical protein
MNQINQTHQTNQITRFLLPLLVLLPVLAPSEVPAQGYPDWVFQDIPSAFTLRKGTVELTARYLTINDTLDVFDVREKQLDGSDLFGGSIGDYSGFKGILNYGVTDRLMLHYSYQYGDLDTTLGTSATFENLDSTDDLSTGWHDVRLRLNLLPERRSAPALALEAAYLRHGSDDASISFTAVRSADTEIIFASRENIELSDLHDRGFELRLLLSKTMSWFTPTVWAGYRHFSVDTEVSTSISLASIKENFDRDLEIDEDALTLGVTFGLQFSKRLPVFLSYRYITLNRSIDTDKPLNTSILARYTNPVDMDEEDHNHIFSGKAVFWLTPHVNLNVQAYAFTNQFLGVVPHYNNPFTNRFFDKTYGYLGFGLGLIF